MIEMTMNTQSKPVKSSLPLIFTFYALKEFTTTVAEHSLIYTSGMEAERPSGFNSIPVCNDLPKRSQVWYAAGK